MSFTLGVAGPSRRMIASGGRMRLGSSAQHFLGSRQLHTSSSYYQHARTKPTIPDDQILPLSAPGTSSSSAHDTDSISHVGTQGNLAEDAKSSAWDPKDDPSLGSASGSPSSTGQQDGTTNTKQGPNPTDRTMTKLNIPWRQIKIPPAWKSQLDPNAPWRKSLLESRRRWSEQAGHQLTAVGLKLNEVTGYKEVERLKEVVNEKGQSGIRFTYTLRCFTAPADEPQRSDSSGYVKTQRRQRRNTSELYLPEPHPNRMSTLYWNANTPGPTRTFLDSPNSFDPTTYPIKPYPPPP